MGTNDEERFEAWWRSWIRDVSISRGRGAYDAVIESERARVRELCDRIENEVIAGIGRGEAHGAANWRACLLRVLALVKELRGE